MDVKVASKLGQAFSRSLDSLSLADGSMLLRMRRASFALFALVGAVGLGLIVFISQLGWPGVVSGPLPGSPTRSGTVDTAVALTESVTPTGGTSGPAAVGDGRPVRNSSEPGSDGPAKSGGQEGSRLGEAKQLAAAPNSQPGQGASQPGAQSPSTTAPEPAPTPPTASPNPTVVVESPSQSGAADQAKKAGSNPGATDASVAKAVSDSRGSGTKSQAQKSASDRGSSSGSSRASEAASAKAKRDEGSAKAPPVAAVPGQSAPPVQSPAAAKEAADAAR